MPMKSSIRSLIRFLNERRRVQILRPGSTTKFCRVLFSVVLISRGTALGLVAFAHHGLNGKPLRLAYDQPQKGRARYAPIDPSTVSAAAEQAAVNAPNPNIPSFGHPIISVIQGVGFEQDLRLDPSNPNRLYTSAPGSLSSDTSWIWQSLDGGLTFKWVTAATALEGKATPACAGGGDSELGVDLNGRIYFCDLTLQNFSTASSDDFVDTITCTN